MVIGRPSPDFLVTETLNMLAAQISQQHAAGGGWVVEDITRVGRAYAELTFVVGHHPQVFDENAKDDRTRIRIEIQVRNP